MRGWKRWVAYVFGVVAVELVLAYMWLVTALEEDCNNGIDRWSCNEVIADFVAVSVIGVPVIATMAAAILYWSPRR